MAQDKNAGGGAAAPAAAGPKSLKPSRALNLKYTKIKRHNYLKHIKLRNLGYGDVRCCHIFASGGESEKAICIPTARNEVSVVYAAATQCHRFDAIGVCGHTTWLLLQRMATQQQEARTRILSLLADLKACSSTRNLQRGRQIHGEALQTGDYSCIYVTTALVKMYAKCGSMLEARQVFDSIKNQDVVCWSALILGYAENGQAVTALDLFSRMKCAPDSFAFVAALKACASLALEQDGSRRAECGERGRKIHAEIGRHSNMYVQSALIDMYAKCGSMAEARQVFSCIKKPDVVTWNALILGYAENGEGSSALKLFDRMKFQRCIPNTVTYIAALKACSSLAADQDGAECLDRGRQIHSQIGSNSSIHLQCSLVDMYAKCCSMVEARRVFDAIKHPDVVSWNALILGYADNGEGVVALDLFARMKSQGCAPNWISFAAVLKACGLLGALESGRKVHAEMDTETERSPKVITCLVDFYARCASMEEAKKVFDTCPVQTRDMRSWTALLAGYSRLADPEAVFGLFNEMQDAGFQPDAVTFLCILTCCTYAGGLVEKASAFFLSMSTKHGITPSVGHYSCMVNILGHSGQLDAAVALLRSMSIRPDAVIWVTLLDASRTLKNVGIGTLAFRSLVSVDITNAAAYVTMAHLYGSKGMREEQEMVLALRDRFRAWKEAGQSCWTNETGESHIFLINPKS